MTDKLFQNQLYSSLCRFGDFYKLDVYHSPEVFLNKIKIFENNWVQYNNTKNFIKREGLSITSIDGKLSGIPDLDSLYEYNIINNTQITEHDINVPTDVYKYALPYFEFIKDYLIRSHIIRLLPGGFFPIHRDNKSVNVKHFRLFVPLVNCNPPKMFFMLDHDFKILNFDHGSLYFINTSVPHILFNASGSTSYFIVLNIDLNENSVDTILQKFSAK